MNLTLSKKWINRSLLVLAIGLFSTGSFAQLSGTKTVPGDYASIDAFVTDVNGQGVGAGGVIVYVIAGHTETAPAGGINMTATGTIADPIIIQKSGAGANPIISAYAGGTGTPSSAITDGIFSLNGSDYVTIDGIDLTDANTTNPSTMEYGYAFFKLSATDGCQFNTIKNCTVTLSINNNASGSGANVDGSKGIWLSSSIRTTSTTSLTVTAASGSNSSNKIQSNTILNTNIGIAAIGYAASTPFTLADTGNELGGTSALLGNTISNFGGATSASNASAGIRTLAQYNFEISYNVLNNNNGTGINHVSTLRGIYVNTATSAVGSINNNTVTLVTGTTTSTTEGISNNAGSTAAANTININNNALFFGSTTLTSGTINGIINGGTPAILNINGNSITSASAAQIAGTGTWLLIDGGSPGTLNINNNNISSIGRSGVSGTLRAIRFATPSTITNVTGNVIENLAFITPISTGSIDGIYSLSSAVTVNLTNNTIRNLATPLTGTLTGIREYSVSGTKTFTGNEIYGFATTLGGSGGGSFYGIHCTVGDLVITSNRIYQLNNTGGSVGTINGIWITGGTSSLVSRNKIYDLSSTSTGASVNGILLSGNTSNSVFNNVISDLRTPNVSATNPLNGINVTAGTAANLFFNSVYLNGTSTGTNFGSSAVSVATGTNITLRNNIFINESTATGTGFTTAYRRSSTTLTNYLAASNRNLFYAGAPSATNLIMYDGTNSYQTLTAYQTAMATRDANSLTGEAFTYGTAGSFFTSLTGSSVDFLRPVAGITTQVESGATNVTTPLITLDYSAVTRAGNGGYAGTGTNPDMGAYEFEGVTPAPVITLNSVTPPATVQCATVDRLVSVNITTGAGTITGANLVYAYNGAAQTPIVMVNTAGTTWTATIPASTPVNAVVTWGVVATNSLALNSSYTGATYSDEPLLGLTATATASMTTVCSGSPTMLSASFTPGSAPALAPTYALPPAVSSPTTDEDLANITISEGATILLNNTTARNSLVGTIGTATGTAGSYSNFTSFASLNLTSGKTYSFSASSIQDVNAYGNAMAIYIDYNRNGVFTDAGELIYTSPSTVAGTHTVTGTFVVPANASSGFARMRVISNEGLITSPTQSISWGEYEEYSVNLTPAPASVTWMDGATTVGTGNPLTVNPAVTTTYTANVSYSGCVVSPAPTVSVTVNPLPATPTKLNSAQCGTQVPTASVTSTSGLTTPTFVWYDMTTGGTVQQSDVSTTFLSNVTATTTFYVSELNTATGCESARVPVTVTVAIADDISASTSAATICIGSSVTLTAANTNGTPNQSYTYTWSNATTGSGLTSATGTTTSVTPTIPGTYTYDLAGVDGACSAIASISVTVNPFTSSLTAVNATCNGANDGTFTLTSSSCGTTPYTYSVEGGAFDVIPTNLTPGTYSIVVRDANLYTSAAQSITITEPLPVTIPTAGAGISVCEGATSAQVTATDGNTSNFTINLPIDVASQPIEVNSAPGNIVTTVTVPVIPTGATITGVTINLNGLVPNGFSWQSDVRIGLSGLFTNAAATGTGALSNSTAFNYTRTLAGTGFPLTGGTLNLLYWDNYNDEAGDDCTFPIGAGVGSIVITYTLPNASNITWFEASNGGTSIFTGSPLETVGTTLLPNTSTAGTYTFYAEGNNGSCVSATRTPVTVIVNAASTSSATVVNCGPYMWNAISRTTSGTYTFTTTNAVGCDSVATLNLTVNSPSTSTTIVSNCVDYLWTNGTTYTASGMYTQTLMNAVGCDSVATLDLTIKVPTTSTTTISQCTSYTWTNGTTYNGSGTFTQTLMNAAGCDSVATLIFTLGTSASTTTVVECESYTWTNGSTYTTSGVYTQVLMNAAGCDSTATLNLTINGLVATATNNGDGTLSASTGTSYVWINCSTNAAVAGATSQGFAPTANGSYAVVVTNAAGCSDTSSCVAIGNIGIKEIAGQGVSIYPNPTANDVVIHFPSNSASIEVMDATGKVLATSTIVSGGSVSLGDYNRGVYYIRLKSENGTSIHKLIKN